MFKSNKIKEHWLLVILLIAAAAIRFYRLPEMASFDFDQEYAANFAWSVLKEYPIQLIGQGLSVQGLFMGPWYFYFLTPFFALFNLHPVGGAVGSVILGLITIGAYYYFGYKIFGKLAGLIAAFLRAFIFSKIGADWAMIPSSCELPVLITWYCFYQYWLKNTRYLPLLGFIFGLYTSFHPILFPFYLVFLGLVIFNRTFPNLKTLILSVTAFLVPVSPLIIFEFFHNFLEIKILFGFFDSQKSAVSLSLLTAVKYLKTIIERPQLDMGININPASLVFLFVFAAMIYFRYKKIAPWKDSFHPLILTFTILIFALYYWVLPAHVSEYYFIGPATLIFFYFAIVLGQLSKEPKTRIFVAIFLLGVLVINLLSLKEKWLSPSLTTLENKDKIVKEIISRELKGNKFFVSYINTPGWNSGFSYFFKLYGNIPYDKIVNNSNYTIVVPKNLSLESLSISYGNIGLILPKISK